MLEDKKKRAGGTNDQLDLSGFKLLSKHPHPTRQLIDELEAENNLKAHLKYLLKKPSKNLAPFDYEWMQSLHVEMYGDVWEWAGKFRITNKNIGVDKYQIGQQLGILSKDIIEWPKFYNTQEFKNNLKKEYSQLPKIPMGTEYISMLIHHRAVYIHPFEDGNGRWSRLLANIWLKQNDMPEIVWPSIAEASLTREEYLKAVKAADKMDYKQLMVFHMLYRSEE